MYQRSMTISQYRLAKEIGVPAQRFSEIIAGKRSITADRDLRLYRFFGLSKGCWLRVQAAYDTEIAEEKLDPSLKDQTLVLLCGIDKLLNGACMTEKISQHSRVEGMQNSLDNFFNILLS